MSNPTPTNSTIATPIHAIILSAGYGKRMHPLTQTTPKPLLKIKNKTLLDWQIDKLKHHVIQIHINTAYHAEQIHQHIEKHQKKHHNSQTQITHEGNTPLESGTGIINILRNQPFIQQFILHNADVLCDIQIDSLIEHGKSYPLEHPKAHLILTPNPEHNPNGDYALTNQQLQHKTNNSASNSTNNSTNNSTSYTYTGIGYFNRQFFNHYLNPKTPLPKNLTLKQIIDEHINQHNISGEIYSGTWIDVGTIERYQYAQQHWQATER